MHISPRFLSASVAILSLTIIGCSNPQPTSTDTTPGAGEPVAVDESTTPISADRSDGNATATAILASLARGDWETLASLSSHTGVRFTPYTHVNADSDRTVANDDLSTFLEDKTKHVWGVEEGSGEPIEMTNAEYLARYVWDHDYRDATDIRWNAEQNRGSMIDNVQEVYPGASIVEYHFAGFDDQYGGMDWRSLRLVLAQNDDAEWTLYGLIHDEWTP